MTSIEVQDNEVPDNEVPDNVKGEVEIEGSQGAESPFFPKTRFDSWTDRASEWINPILVKESRQALKSRQFILTFSLILVFACGWSFLGVALLTPGIYYAARGYEMLIGYYWILAFPLILIVPYSAFRSLASEMEEGTFELLAVSTLRPRQIVGGKLASATLQIMIYFSVLAPCIAFTYLLRGVEIGSIAVMLIGMFLLSLFLSIISLFFATVTKSKGWQVVMSIILILTLASIFVGLGTLVTAIMNSGDQLFPFSEGWYEVLFPIGSILIYGLLCFQAACERITFASENRSTKLRWIMLAQHIFLTFIFAYAWLNLYNYRYSSIEPFAAIITLAGVHWWIMGAMMTGEVARLSKRAQRTLPQNTLSRTLLTWFNPGPTTGYVFATLNLFSFALFSAVIVNVSVQFFGSASWLSRVNEWRDDLTWFGLLFACYMSIFLGCGKLCIGFISKYSKVGPFTGILVNAMLVMAMALFSFILQISFGDRYLNDYSWIQIPNVAWTLSESLDTNTSGYYPTILIRLTLPAMAMIMLLLHLCLGSRELNQDRIEAPQRVKEEEQKELGSEKGPEEPTTHALD